MKKLRGKHHFKSYKELCAALDIDSAPKGPKREEQKSRIGKTYQITIHANNSIDLQRIPKKAAVRQRKLDQGQIRMIDGREVDLGSNLLYKDTHIDKLILFRALTAKDKIDTKEGFVISCFERTKFFRELLARGGLESAKYSVESLHLVHELVVSRLYAMVNARLNRFEEKDYIQINRFYLLKNGNTASIEEVEPYVKQALRKMGLRREFQAYTSKERRKEFQELRNEYYEKDYGDRILCKKFIIEPLFELDDELKPGEIHEVDDDIIVGLSNREIQIILTSFFDIFREKAIFDYENSLNPLRKGRLTKEKETLRQLKIKCADEVREIINTYCAYINTPNEGEQTAFYSIERLARYYDDEIEFPLSFDADDYEDTENEEKYEQGDTLRDYDEVDGDGKNDYDYYNLSNLTEEENKSRQFRLKDLIEYMRMLDEGLIQDEEEDEHW